MNFPPLPDGHALAVLILIVLALYLFTRDKLPLETSSLAILTILIIGFEAFPYSSGGQRINAIDFFSGFGHEALIAVCALMIAGQGLIRTGALEPVGRCLASLWIMSPTFSLLLTLLVGGGLSAFVNNVPIVVLLLPILTSISIRTDKPASSLLMPMGLSTLVGGMSTTIGTSTNLLVISIAADLGLPRLNMFDFFLPASLVSMIAIFYLWLIAPLMLPSRKTPLNDLSPRIFIGHLHFDTDSSAIGKTLSEINQQAGRQFDIIEVQRGLGMTVTPLPDIIIKAGDRMSVRDTPQNLKDLEGLLEARLYNKNSPVDDEHPLIAEDQQIAEIVVIQGSPLVGSTLARVRFSERYQLFTLALHRAGINILETTDDVDNVQLHVGDVILVQGSLVQISKIKRDGKLLVLDATVELPHTNRSGIALAIMFGIVIMSALGILPIAISAVSGVFTMIITGCIRWRDAAEALSAQVILIVVSSLALGMALLKTGGAEYLAQIFLVLSGSAPPPILLSCLMLVMAVLTNIISNNAAAVIGTPIAISVAQQLSLPAEPFVLAVLFGANMSYATPMAYKTNLLVMNAGGYHFTDFMRVGIPLTLIVWISLSWLLPQIYGLW
jgi:di/tricarboxylate transporter